MARARARFYTQQLRLLHSIKVFYLLRQALLSLSVCCRVSAVCVLCLHHHQGAKRRTHIQFPLDFGSLSHVGNHRPCILEENEFPKCTKNGQWIPETRAPNDLLIQQQPRSTNDDGRNYKFLYRGGDSCYYYFDKELEKKRKRKLKLFLRASFLAPINQLS